MTHIPLFDCRLGGGAIAALSATLSSGKIASGPLGVELETRLSKMFGDREVVAISDSTHALSLALILAGVRAGDEVLTLAFNCLSSTSSIVNVGAIPVWVDIDVESATASLPDIEAALTDRTRAVVVYHMAGYPAPLVELKNLCDRYRVPLIEDANNSFGATVNGKLVGTFGDFSIFSFYANRQINAIDGAALICPNAATAIAARRLRRFGIDLSRFRDRMGEIDPKCDVPVIGISAALSDAHAALALSSLDDFEQRLSRTRKNVAALMDGTSSIGMIRPVVWSPGNVPAFWVWLIRSPCRDQIMVALKESGVGCSKIHQPNDLYSGFGAIKRRLDGTRRFATEVLGLPCGWWLCEAEIEPFQVFLGQCHMQK